MHRVQMNRARRRTAQISFSLRLPMSMNYGMR